MKETFFFFKFGIAIELLVTVRMGEGFNIVIYFVEKLNNHAKKTTMIPVVLSQGIQRMVFQPFCILEKSLLRGTYECSDRWQLA